MNDLLVQNGTTAFLDLEHSKKKLDISFIKSNMINKIFSLLRLLQKRHEISYIQKKKKNQQKNQILLKYLFHEFFTFNGFMELSVDILK